MSHVFPLSGSCVLLRLRAGTRLELQTIHQFSQSRRRPHYTRTFSWLKVLSYLRHAKVILSLKGCNCENRWIVCSSRHDRLEAGCGDPYKVETHHALVYRSIVSGPPALQQLGYLHSIHYWARASNCFGLFAGSIATVCTHAYCRELQLHRVSAEAATCPAWLHARHLISCYLKPAACSA